MLAAASVAAAVGVTLIVQLSPDAQSFNCVLFFAFQAPSTAVLAVSDRSVEYVKFVILPPVEEPDGSL